MIIDYTSEFISEGYEKQCGFNINNLNCLCCNFLFELTFLHKIGVEYVQVFRCYFLNTKHFQA